MVTATKQPMMMNIRLSPFFCPSLELGAAAEEKKSKHFSVDPTAIAVFEGPASKRFQRKVKTSVKLIIHSPVGKLL